MKPIATASLPLATDMRGVLAARLFKPDGDLFPRLEGALLASLAAYFLLALMCFALKG